MITEDDCGTKEGIVIDKNAISGMEISVAKHIRGRFLAAPVVTADGKTLFKIGDFLTKKDAQKIEAEKVESVTVRSPLTCKTQNGICVKCYGADLGRNKLTAEDVGGPPQVDHRSDPGATYGDVGDADAPRTAKGVRDDDRHFQSSARP